MATALLLAAAVGAAPAPAAAAGPPRFGIDIASVQAGVSTARLDADLDDARRVGARLVRLHVVWSDLEPAAPGGHDPAVLAAVDHVVAGARRRGLRVVLQLTSTPCWASAAPATLLSACAPGQASDALRYPPADPQSFVGVATFLAARYGSALAAFEIWNEPDLAAEYYWAGPDKVARYVALVRALYRPLQRANPRMRVLAGAFVGGDGRWLSALYAQGMKGHYDALAVHFYDLTLYSLRLTRRVMAAHGDRAPVWIGEFGWSACGRGTELGHACVSRAVQARSTADLVGLLTRRSWVRAALLYTVRDDDGLHFGLRDAAGRPRPVLGALRRALAAPRRAPVRPLRLRLTARGGRLVAMGSGPAGDVLELAVRRGGALRYRAAFRLDRDNRFRLALPRALGTRGLAVGLRQPWSGRAVTRRR
jgi:hypothetical protein